MGGAVLLAGTRSKPESLCPVESCVRSPLPDGRVDLNTLLSGYINSGFAIDFLVESKKDKGRVDRGLCPFNMRSDELADSKSVNFQDAAL